MVPFLFLQGMRRIDVLLDSKYGRLISDVVLVTSILLSALSTVLTILFPAVEFHPISGRFQVGIIDVQLPVDFSEGLRRGSMVGTAHEHEEELLDSGSVTARILYPTNDKGGSIPYFDPRSANVICQEMMKAGAPGPLKKFSWMLHTWQLTKLRAIRNACPAEVEEDSRTKKLPIVIFSHGLTGISAIYSYQALSLAASGTLVLMVDHTDMSACCVRRRDGSFLLYDCSPVTDLMKGEKSELEYVRGRRAQTEHRAAECLSALNGLTLLNRKNIPALCGLNVSFVGKLDESEVTIMGHSFGGATALTVAAIRPDLFSAVVAHDPAVDWMPDKARRALFLKTGIQGAAIRYEGGTGGFRDADQEEKKDAEREADNACDSFHSNDMLFLYSEEWFLKGWGAYKYVKDLDERSMLGPNKGVSNVGIIRGAKHSEFSDTCIMTPIWLARGTGLTGDRNPHDTSYEIAEKTIAFLDSSRRKREARRRKIR
jgi:hypothetical protein